MSGIRAEELKVLGQPGSKFRDGPVHSLGINFYARSTS
jgi:hypothetical protein